MPEGPEIKRAADRISKAIVGQSVTEIFFAFEHLKGYEQALTGRKITAVESRGKALLIHFDNRLSIYSHNQLYGKWMIRKSYSYPQTNRQLRLAIHNPQKSALLYSASDIEVLTPEEIMEHPFLKRLGLDVLDTEVTPQQIEERLRDQRFWRRRLAGLLLDQHCLCGLGNYLRSEVLFVARISPTFRPVDCSPTQLTNLAEASINLANQSYFYQGITNDLQLAQMLKEQGKHRWEYRHWVFNRQGRPCFVCGAAIIKEMLAGRRLYYCPHCQTCS